MIDRGAWQLWANYVAEDLDDVRSGQGNRLRGSSRARVERLRSFARAVQRGADPHARRGRVEPGSGLAPEDVAPPNIDQDQESYALALWLSDAGDTRDTLVSWAASVERVAESVLQSGKLPEPLMPFTAESLQPFLARIQRLDEAPDDDFVTLALRRTGTEVR